MTEAHRMQLVRQLHGVMKRWPLGTVCWHAATGERLIVIGYKVHQQGVWPSVRGGDGSGNLEEFQLRRQKPPADEDGEAWKQPSSN